MAKFIISSSGDCFDRMANSIDPVFSISSSQSGNFGSVQTYSKLNVPTINCYCCNGGFALGAGTFVCEGKRDAAALQAVFCRYQGDVQEIQRQLMGSYVLMIVKDKYAPVLFVDGGGLYNFYYCMGKGRFSAANSFFHLSAALDDPSLNEDAAMQVIFQNAILDDQTIIEGVRRLGGERALVFEDDTWAVHELPAASWGIPYDKAFWPSLSKRFESFGRAFSQTGVGMTGGQDSRMALAVLLSIGLKPHLIYWRGDSTTTNTKQTDENIVNAIASRCVLVVERWNASDGERLGYRKALRTYGEYALAYGYNENLLQALRNTSCDFLTFGYFGELLRNIEETEAYEKEEFSVEEYFDGIYLKDFYKEAYGNFPRYRSAQIDFLRKFCLRRGLNPERLTKDDFQTIHTETYRKHADVFMENFVNLFVYSSAVLGDKVITDTINKVPFDAKQASRPMLEALTALAGELVEVPFYSHSRKMEYDPERFCLRDAHETQRNLKQYMQQKKKGAWYYSLARNAYHLLNGDRKSMREAQRDAAEREALVAQVEHANLLPSFEVSRCPGLTSDNRLMVKIINYNEMYDEMKCLARKKD